jgi:hypothetical protein
VNDMQVVIEEIVNNIRAIDRETVLSPEVMRQIVHACLNAVQDARSHDERIKEERSVEGPWGLSGERGH